jgi:hypothetical protein
LKHFAALYAAILAKQPTSETGMPAPFLGKYRETIVREKAKLDAAIGVLSVVPGQRS